MFEAISQQYNTFIQHLNDLIQRNLLHTENITVVIVVVNITVIDITMSVLSSSLLRSRTSHTTVWISVQVETFLIERALTLTTTEVFTVLFTEHTNNCSPINKYIC